MKRAVINLTNEQLTVNQTSLLNLDPNFAPTNKQITFVDIIDVTESTTLHLEN